MEIGLQVAGEVSASCPVCGKMAQQLFLSWRRRGLKVFGKNKSRAQNDCSCKKYARLLQIFAPSRVNIHRITFHDLFKVLKIRHVFGLDGLNSFSNLILFINREPETQEPDNFL